MGNKGGESLATQSRSCILSQILSGSRVANLRCTLHVQKKPRTQTLTFSHCYKNYGATMKDEHRQ